MKIRMIIRPCFIIAVLIVLADIHNFSIAQTTWYKYPGNLAFYGGQDGWRRSKRQKAVIYDNGQSTRNRF
ncbi:MAG: hypothetical protein K8R53_03815 [Bacteroidales bacterium]|nr:hypothetical protein [Bacteroidales bacterium]